MKMQRFRDMSINRKLTVLILTSCATVLVLAGVAMIAAEIATSRRFMVDELGVKADLVARASQAPLAFLHQSGDSEDLAKTLSALAVDPHILRACIYDKNGTIVGTYVRKDGNPQFPPHPSPMVRTFSSRYLEVTHPVMVDGNQLGTIYIRADLGRLYGQIEMHAAIILAILVGAILLTIAIAPRLRQPIAEPVLALAAVARRVAQDNDYSARAKKYGNDEVGLLTDAFNRMLGEIESTHTSLRVAKESAESANKAKDQFLAVLSHELRTPLTPVLLTTSLLQENHSLPAEVQDDVQTIRRHVELEARLIDDMLDLTRITRGKLQLHFEPADSHKIIKDAIKICLSDRMEDVTIALAAKDYYVRADPGRLTQVFWNLLSNARKFTPQGSKILVRSENPAPGRIRIQVIDSGIGIDPKALPRIFNAFDQVDSAVARRVGGLGLGLTIAKALVDAHGGTLVASSEGPGTGSTFTVELNTIPVPSNQPQPTSPDPLQSNSSAAVPLNLLLVEDHASTLKIMTKLLKQFGYNVRGAVSVQDALTAAASSKIDLVISDLGLPDGSGYDLMRELHARYGMKGISVSGFGMEQDIARSAEAGFCQHLTKPIDLAKLQAAIQNAVGSTNCSAASTHV